VVEIAALVKVQLKQLQTTKKKQRNKYNIKKTERMNTTRQVQMHITARAVPFIQARQYKIYLLYN